MITFYDRSCFRSPAISGGVLGINRHYFQNIGAYDPGMLMWGIENLELSLRVRSNHFVILSKLNDTWMHSPFGRLICLHIAATRRLTFDS